MKKFLLSFVTMAVVLTGCGGGGSEPTSSEPASEPQNDAEPITEEEVTLDSSVEIDFWHAMSGGHEESLQAIVEEFNANSEFITVKAVNQGSYDDLQQKIMAAAKAKGLPAISQVTTNVVPEYIANDFITSLDSYMNHETYGMTEEEITDIVDIFKESSTWDGTMYSIPFSKSTRILYYNSGMLEEHSLDVPKTWEDIRTIAETVTKDGVVGMGFENSFEMEFESILRQMGGEYVDEAGLEAKFASEKGIAALQLIKEMVDEGIARTAGEDGYMSNPFGRGDVAMYIGSSAGIPHVRGAAEGNIEWSATVLPTYNGVAATPFAGNDIVMYNQSSEEEQLAAWEFMKYLISTDVTAQWAQESGYLPVRYSAMELDSYRAFIEEFPEHGAGEQQFDAGYFSARVAGGNAVRNIILEELENIMLDRKTVEEGLQFAEDQANDALKK
ncbi:ABC transporter substrate-binding protein [Alkalihalobacterium bogoriense]|uniref:ABC transporter substrate-binding protein n=1 Tax=Alkalihalobacterium bogoriense TaxID=246272 RepID=UPI00047E8CB2|nr:ABC transporter substrate-binding protein [Alkalihalobacterium bogoriense]